MTETRLLHGGVDSDTAPYGIENGALLNSVNAQSLIQDSQNSEATSFIPGNTPITPFVNFLGGALCRLLGKCASSNNQRIFLFLWVDIPGGISENCIVSIDVNNGATKTIIREGWVFGGFGWTGSLFIDCEEAGGLLFFTEEKNGVRYVNTESDYSSGIAQANLSLTPTPPAIPLTAQRDTDATVISNIQFKGYQFSYRITNTDNFVSVMAPYSLTATPASPKRVAQNSDYGNVIDVSVPTEQKFSSNWKRIDLIVRDLQTGAFHVIKEYYRSSQNDAALINGHNSGTPLSFRWTGENLYILDENYTSKQFSNIPIAARRLRLAASRLLLAGCKEGYDTPPEKPAYQITQTVAPLQQPSKTMVQSYILYARKKENFEAWFAVVCQWQGKYYLLPKEVSVGHIDKNMIWFPTNSMHKIGQSKTEDELWAVPQEISASSLIELKEQQDPFLQMVGQYNQVAQRIRYNMVAEANGVDFLDTWDRPQTASIYYKEFIIAWNLPGNPDDRAFMSGTDYKVGLQYYDANLRKSGVIELERIRIPQLSAWQPKVTTFLNISLSNNNPSPIPEWAEYFSVTLSQQQTSIRVMQYIPGTIKVAFKDGLDEIKFRGLSDAAHSAPGLTLYGIAIPLQNITKYGYGYEYSPGDKITLSAIKTGGGADLFLTGAIKELYAGYIIMELDTSQIPYMSNAVSDSGHYIYNSGENNLAPPTTALSWNRFTAELLLRAFDYDLNGTPKPWPPFANDVAKNRQGYAIVTIYNGAVPDPELYEVAQFGKISSVGSQKQFSHFFSTGTLLAQIQGDHYIVEREGNGRGYCLAHTPYERDNLKAINDTGRVTLKDTIGQRYNKIIRWSNTNIPGSKENGYANFDPADYKLIEENAGNITSLVLTTKGIQEGGQMLVLCDNCTYVTLIGRQQITDASQSGAFVAAAHVMGDLNPIAGKWGCQNPKAIAEIKGNVFWLDGVNQLVIRFGGDGANEVSKYKASRLWRSLLSDRAELSDLISFGINQYTTDLLIHIPQVPFKRKKTLKTFNIEDPFSAEYPDQRTYIFNWNTNTWRGSYHGGGEFIQAGSKLFSWRTSRLFEEFSGTPGVFQGVSSKAIISIPFNEGYPAIKSPRSLVIDSSRAPDECYIVADGMPRGEGFASPISAWLRREGSFMAPIGRDRNAPGAANPQAWNMSGINGARLKGKQIKVCLIFDSAKGGFSISSATLIWEPAAGQPLR